jgi:hypothetical protein
VLPGQLERLNIVIVILSQFQGISFVLMALGVVVLCVSLGDVRVRDHAYARWLGYSVAVVLVSLALVPFCLGR